jgi:membrane-associated protease RseP (regulator of RpoE activity)
MFIRSFAAIVFVAMSIVLAAGQPPVVKKDDASKPVKVTNAPPAEKMRDMAFSSGIDMQTLIRELAQDIGINVLFDAESFRSPRKMVIDLKNVTTAAALDAIALQEGLVIEDAGPRMILVASRHRGTSIPQIGVGLTPLTEQLKGYFGVEVGVLINDVRPASPALAAGLKAGDVIVELDGVTVRGPVVLCQAFKEKGATNVTLKVVRDHKPMSIMIMARTIPMK